MPPTVWMLRMFGANPFSKTRRIHREAERINRRRPRPRRRAPVEYRPVGPKLVRGRGLARRRAGNPWPTLIYVLLAASGTIWVFAKIVTPFLAG